MYTNLMKLILCLEYTDKQDLSVLDWVLRDLTVDFLKRINQKKAQINHVCLEPYITLQIKKKGGGGASFTSKYNKAQ